MLLSYLALSHLIEQDLVVTATRSYFLSLLTRCVWIMV